MSQKTSGVWMCSSGEKLSKKRDVSPLKHLTLPTITLSLHALENPLDNASGEFTDTSPSRFSWLTLLLFVKYVIKLNTTFTSTLTYLSALAVVLFAQ